MLTDAQKKEADAAIRREVARGGLTVEQGDERRQTLGITPAGHELPSYSKRELARQLLTRPERGLTELEAYRALERDEAGVIAELATEIEGERQRLATRDRGRIAEAQAASPEGRQLAAAQLADEAAARTEQARRARLLLESEGTFPAADIPRLSDDEALRAAGFESEPDPATDLSANLRAAGEGGETA